MPPSTRSLAVVLALALALGAVACGERTEPTGPAVDLFPLVVTGPDDRPLTVPAPARRIALLDPSFESTLAALGAGDRIAGAPVGTDGRLRLRELERLQPDLVVASPATDDRALSAAAKTGAVVYIAAGSSIREVERTITQLGAITSTPAAARRLVRVIEGSRREVNQRVEGRARTRVFVDLGFFTTASDQTLVGDLVRAAGGANVAADIADGGPIDLADLRRADPSVYITTDSETTLASLRADRRTKRLRAVREGRVVFIAADELEPGPGIGQALQQLARALHPDAFR